MFENNTMFPLDVTPIIDDDRFLHEGMLIVNDVFART